MAASTVTMMMMSIFIVHDPKHIKGSKEHYLLGQNTTCDFLDSINLKVQCAEEA